MKVPSLTRGSVTSHDEAVVLELLEEIYHLVVPHHIADATRLHAAARLYLDTRDTFEAVEHHVEGPVHDKPKLLRKLSTRKGLLKETARSSLDSAASSPRDPTSAESTPRIQEEHHDDSNEDHEEEHHNDPDDGQSTDVEVTEHTFTTIDRIQEMFRRLGELLGRAILDELHERNLPIKNILHYVRFLPQDMQWTAYKEARIAEVLAACNASATSTSLALKQRAEFVKEQIRKDVDTVCLFAVDGTLATIFGDDIDSDEEHVGEKFESLVTEVYASYLKSIVSKQMDHLVNLSEQWQTDMSTAATLSPPFAQFYTRNRKYRIKSNIFPTNIDTLPAFANVSVSAGVKILVSDQHQLGIWWLKSVVSVTDRDIGLIHQDDSRGIQNHIESLDGHIFMPLMGETNPEFFRLAGRNGGLSKWIGQRILVNNGKDSLWLEATVTEVEDRRCKLQLKDALLQCPTAATWVEYLSTTEWIPVRDLRFNCVPLNPDFRVHMGHKFRDMLEEIYAVVVEISSIFPNDNLEHKVARALWRSLEEPLSRGEHIYARYFRSVLNQETLSKRTVLMPAPPPRTRASILHHGQSARMIVPVTEETVRGMTANSVVASAPTPHSPSVSANSSSCHGEGSFDHRGVYHSHQALAEFASLVGSPRGKSGGSASRITMSPFEKLTHHLLEETEVLAVCLQANNVALARAFAQVFLEKLSKLLRVLKSRLEQEETSSLEAVVAEYANSCRFLYAWRICRYEMDSVARQRRSKRDGKNLHTEGVDRSFDRMEKTLADAMQVQLHFLQRIFFHEGVSIIFPGIYEQSWGSSKPWFSNSRCTYAVQFLVFRFESIFDHILVRLLPQYERNLGVHEKLHDMAAWMIMDLLSCIAASYEEMVVSRARTTQWKMDSLYLVCGMHKLLRTLDRMLIPRITTLDERGKKKIANEVRTICLRMLVCVALRTGPATVVLDAVMKKLEAENFEQQLDPQSELELHIHGIQMALAADSPSSSARVEHDPSTFWESHSAFGQMELKRLANISLNWTALISRCTMSKDCIVSSLKLRHELGDWEYPPLSDDDKKNRELLRGVRDASLLLRIAQSERSTRGPSRQTIIDAVYQAEKAFDFDSVARDDDHDWSNDSGHESSSVRNGSVTEDSVLEDAYLLHGSRKAGQMGSTAQNDSRRSREASTANTVSNGATQLQLTPSQDSLDEEPLAQDPKEYFHELPILVDTKRPKEVDGNIASADTRAGVE
ncbi:TPA: hypothetical protein N0F65_012460 [Lagenidium giganteum]|uniref:Uncharacterized protein n=1 Tax=Lagenidium giganteum TaxID=4803 RepID=A0AAV2YIZ4_9STRA|nr:TPA: hypothetical protein N0F65_012460 [Lagenidium giganteum]